MIPIFLGPRPSPPFPAGLTLAVTLAPAGAGDGPGDGSGDGENNVAGVCDVCGAGDCTSDGREANSMRDTAAGVASEAPAAAGAMAASGAGAGAGRGAAAAAGPEAGGKVA